MTSLQIPLLLLDFSESNWNAFINNILIPLAIPPFDLVLQNSASSFDNRIKALEAILEINKNQLFLLSQEKEEQQQQQQTHEPEIQVHNAAVYNNHDKNKNNNNNNINDSRPITQLCERLLQNKDDVVKDGIKFAAEIFKFLRDFFQNSSSSSASSSSSSSSCTSEKVDASSCDKENASSSSSSSSFDNDNTANYHTDTDNNNIPHYSEREKLIQIFYKQNMHLILAKILPYALNRMTDPNININIITQKINFRMNEYYSFLLDLFSTSLVLLLECFYFMKWSPKNNSNNNNNKNNFFSDKSELFAIEKNSFDELPRVVQEFLGGDPLKKNHSRDVSMHKIWCDNFAEKGELNSYCLQAVEAYAADPNQIDFLIRKVIPKFFELMVSSSNSCGGHDSPCCPDRTAVVSCRSIISAAHKIISNSTLIDTNRRNFYKLVLLPFADLRFVVYHYYYFYFDYYFGDDEDDDSGSCKLFASAAAMQGKLEKINSDLGFFSTWPSQEEQREVATAIRDLGEKIKSLDLKSLASAPTSLSPAAVATAASSIIHSTTSTLALEDQMSLLVDEEFNRRCEREAYELRARFDLFMALEEATRVAVIKQQQEQRDKLLQAHRLVRQLPDRIKKLETVEMEIRNEIIMERDSHLTSSSLLASAAWRAINILQQRQQQARRLRKTFPTVENFHKNNTNSKNDDDDDDSVLESVRVKSSTAALLSSRSSSVNFETFSALIIGKEPRRQRGHHHQQEQVLQITSSPFVDDIEGWTAKCRSKLAASSVLGNNNTASFCAASTELRLEICNCNVDVKRGFNYRVNQVLNVIILVNDSNTTKAFDAMRSAHEKKVRTALESYIREDLHFGQFNVRFLASSRTSSSTTRSRRSCRASNRTPSVVVSAAADVANNNMMAQKSSCRSSSSHSRLRGNGNMIGTNRPAKRETTQLRFAVADNNNNYGHHHRLSEIMSEMIHGCEASARNRIETERIRELTKTIIPVHASELVNGTMTNKLEQRKDHRYSAEDMRKYLSACIMIARKYFAFALSLLGLDDAELLLLALIGGTYCQNPLQEEFYGDIWEKYFQGVNGASTNNNNNIIITAAGASGSCVRSASSAFSPVSNSASASSAAVAFGPDCHSSGCAAMFQLVSDVMTFKLVRSPSSWSPISVVAEGFLQQCNAAGHASNNDCNNNNNKNTNIINSSGTLGVVAAQQLLDVITDNNRTSSSRTATAYGGFTNNIDNNENLNMFSSYETQTQQQNVVTTHENGDDNNNEKEQDEKETETEFDNKDHNHENHVVVVDDDDNDSVCGGGKSQEIEDLVVIDPDNLKNYSSPTAAQHTIKRNATSAQVSPSLRTNNNHTTTTTVVRPSTSSAVVVVGQSPAETINSILAQIRSANASNTATPCSTTSTSSSDEENVDEDDDECEKLVQQLIGSPSGPPPSSSARQEEQQQQQQQSQPPSSLATNTNNINKIAMYQMSLSMIVRFWMSSGSIPQSLIDQHPHFPPFSRLLARVTWDLKEKLARELGNLLQVLHRAGQNNSLSSRDRANSLFANALESFSKIITNAFAAPNIMNLEEAQNALLRIASNAEQVVLADIIVATTNAAKVSANTDHDNHHRQRCNNNNNNNAASSSQQQQQRQHRSTLRAPVFASLNTFNPSPIYITIAEYKRLASEIVQLWSNFNQVPKPILGRHENFHRFVSLLDKYSSNFDNVIEARFGEMLKIAPELGRIVNQRCNAARKDFRNVIMENFVVPDTTSWEPAEEALNQVYVGALLRFGEIPSSAENDDRHTRPVVISVGAASHLPLQQQQQQSNNNNHHHHQQQQVSCLPSFRIGEQQYQQVLAAAQNKNNYNNNNKNNNENDDDHQQQQRTTTTSKFDPHRITYNDVAKTSGFGEKTNNVLGILKRTTK